MTRLVTLLLLLSLFSKTLLAQYVSVGTNALMLAAVANVQAEWPVAPRTSLAATVATGKLFPFEGEDDLRIQALELETRFYHSRRRLHEGFYPLIFGQVIATRYAYGSRSYIHYDDRSAIVGAGAGVGYLHVSRGGFYLGASLGLGFALEFHRDLSEASLGVPHFAEQDDVRTGGLPKAGIQVGWRLFNGPGRERWDAHTAGRRERRGRPADAERLPRNVWDALPPVE